MINNIDNFAVFQHRLGRMMDKHYYRKSRDLADKANISYTNLMNYRYGRAQPTLHNLIAIADALNVSIDWLVGRK